MPLEPVTFYWSQMSSLKDDGIHMRVTGYDSGAHWSGATRFDSKADDFEFWNWVYRNRRALPFFWPDDCVPALKEFAATVPDVTLQLLPVGIYLNRESKGPHVPDAVAALVSAFGVDAIKGIYPSQTNNLTEKMLGAFCRGHAEVFLFKEGACDLFLSVGEQAGDISKEIDLITKAMSR